VVIDLPSGRQTFDYDCGAKALQLVMAYYGVDVREDELLAELQCNRYGTPLGNMISVAQKYGFQVGGDNGVSLNTVKQYLGAEHPVIVVVQAWTDRYMTLEDWKADYDHGHYVIVIGYGEGIIIFEDPASFRRTWMTEEEFLARWHDMDPRTGQKFECFGMVLLGRQPAAKALEHLD
jgi:ABC-type bacteriocin/lantibiotic exporter with double-glycine peptidase domain